MSVKNITNRVNLVGAIEIGWDRPGTERLINTITNGNNVFNQDGVTAAVSHAWHDANGATGNSLLRRHQSDPDSGFRDWPGNFELREAVLWTEQLSPSDGPIRIIFNNQSNGPSVQAAGAQIQTLTHGDFDATITAYDLNHQPLGSFTLKCPSNASGNGSAQFVGIQVAGISCIEFTIADITPGVCLQGFAVNRLSVVP